MSVPNSVDGTVTFEDAPVAVGDVELFDADNKSVQKVAIFPDGTFKVTGLAEGVYHASVKVRDWPVSEKEPENVPMPPMPPMPPLPPGAPRPPTGPNIPTTPPRRTVTPAQKAKYDRIDEKYQDPSKSGLSCEVKNGETTKVTWVLEAAKPAQAPP
jgi:hypothetical protein